MMNSTRGHGRCPARSARVLIRRGVLIDVRPRVAPIVVEVIIAAQTIWAKEVELYSAPEDVAAPDAAMQHAISGEWFAFVKSGPFDFEIFCDTAEELTRYAQDRKLRGAEIPCGELEGRRRELSADGKEPRFRCRRRWMLSTYYKR
jgi:hypothetical protein